MKNDWFRVMGNRRAGETPTEADRNISQDNRDANVSGPVLLLDECNTESLALQLAGSFRKELPHWKVWAERLVVVDGDLEDVMAYLHWKELYVIVGPLADGNSVILPASSPEWRNELCTWRDEGIKVAGWDGPFCNLEQASIVLYSRQECVNKVFRVKREEIDWDGF